MLTIGLLFSTAWPITGTNCRDLLPDGEGPITRSGTYSRDIGTTFPEGVLLPFSASGCSYGKRDRETTMHKAIPLTTHDVLSAFLWMLSATRTSSSTIAAYRVDLCRSIAIRPTPRRDQPQHLHSGRGQPRRKCRHLPMTPSCGLPVAPRRRLCLHGGPLGSRSPTESWKPRRGRRGPERGTRTE